MNTQTLDNQFPHRISLSQAAEISGYHQDYLGQLCRLGKIKAAKIGRNWYTTKSELQSLLNFTDNIEVENGSFNGQIDAEEDKGLFDFSQVQRESAPSLDGVRPAAKEETVASIAIATDFEQPIDSEPETSAVAATPVVSDNYVISEVEGIPIRLQADNPSRQHHTIQTLITRMKLDSLRNEVIQVSEVVQTMSDELAQVKELVAKHDEVLRHRKDLSTAYAASIDIAPKAAIREQQLISLEDDSEPIRIAGWQVWFAPALAAFIVVGLAGWLVISNLPALDQQLATIKYPAVSAEQQGEVAGDNDSGILGSEGDTINIEP